MQTRMFLCFHVKNLHENMHVSMYFLHLELTFTPHYIIMDKGLFQTMHIILVHVCSSTMCLSSSIPARLQAFSFLLVKCSEKEARHKSDPDL